MTTTLFVATTALAWTRSCGLTARIASFPSAVDFADVYSKYDAFLLDQFGVVHDGKTCYEGSAECVRRLQELGKRVVVLSNSSKRRRDTIDRLQGLNCGMCTFLDAADVADGVPAISVFTSGDLVHKELCKLQTEDAYSLKTGQNKVFVFGNGDDDEAYASSAGLAPADVGTADFLLARGLFCFVDGNGRQPLDFAGAEDCCDDFLEIAAGRDLPMIVANPDLVRPDGNSSPMPGVLADRYHRKFGGRTFRVGKPHPSIYREALASLAAVGITDKTRIAAVGDSMHHDILGGCRSGVDTIFVAGGVHAAELGVPQGEHVAPDDATLRTFFSNFPRDELPDSVVPGFTMAPSSPPSDHRTENIDQGIVDD